MNLKAYLKHEVFQLIAETADELEMECYVVGGWVRDLLLHRPSSDIDVVVVGSGINMAKLFAHKLGRHAHLSVFKSFGTAQVKFRGMEIEFVGARKESYSHDSRKPVVEDGTLDDDQKRRDFTINALAICLNQERFGELVDPFDGLVDLEKKIIRTPLDPDITFSDDPLRMMRCLRFKSQLDFKVFPETEEALKRNCARIQIISSERDMEELNKILLSPKPSIGLKGLFDCGILSYIFPLHDTVDGQTIWGDRFDYTCEVVDALAPMTRNVWLLWAALLHEACFVSDAMDNHHRCQTNTKLTELFRRMKLPLNHKLDYVQKLVGMHRRPFRMEPRSLNLPAARYLLFEVGEDFDDLMLLCKAIAQVRSAEEGEGVVSALSDLQQTLVALNEKEGLIGMKYPMDGKEIMNELHIPGNAKLGELKEMLLDAVLNGRVPNEHQAVLELLKVRAADILDSRP